MTSSLWQYIWTLERPSDKEKLLELRREGIRHIGYVAFDPYECSDCKSQLRAMQVGIFIPVRKAYFPLEKVITSHSLENCISEMRKNGDEFFVNLKLKINESHENEVVEQYKTSEEQLDFLANLYFVDLSARKTFKQAFSTEDPKKLIKLLKKSKKQFELAMKLLRGEITPQDFDEAM